VAIEQQIFDIAAKKITNKIYVKFRTKNHHLLLKWADGIILKEMNASVLYAIVIKLEMDFIIFWNVKHYVHYVETFMSRILFGPKHYKKFRQLMSTKDVVSLRMLCLFIIKINN
jgi:hypothetical protein